VTGSSISVPYSWWSTADGADNGLDLRSLDYGLSSLDLQSLAIHDAGQKRIVIVGTPGGDLIAIDPNLNSAGSDVTPPQITATTHSATRDLGHGIPSIALYDAGPGTVGIITPVCLDQQPWASLSANQAVQPITGALRQFEFLAGATTPSFSEVPNSRVRLAYPASIGDRPFIPVGVCIADVIDNGDPGDPEELIVTGMFGDVLIYGFAGEQVSAAPIQSIRLPGCIGMHGSIVVEGGNVYIAGSLGLWKLEQIPGAGQ